MSLIAKNYPALTTEEAETITNNFCGIPPDRKKIEYHIWLNEQKYKFYWANPFYKNSEQHHQHLDSFQKLIACGKKLLNEIETPAVMGDLQTSSL